MNDKVSVSPLIGCLGVLVGVAMVALFIAIEVVDTGEACAVLRGGNIRAVWGPGVHFGMPFVDSTTCYSTREVVYETSRDPGTSQQDYTDFTVDTTTRDGQPIQAAYSVVFSVDPERVRDVYTNTGRDMDEVVRRVVSTVTRSEVRNALKQFDAETLYTGRVSEAQADISTRVKALFDRSGIRLGAFLLREIVFDDSFTQSIKEKQSESVAADKAVNEQRRKETQAETEKNVKIAEAQGRAEAKRIEADAEAEAIRVQGAALRDNPEVLRLRFIERQTVKWGILPENSPMLPFVQMPAFEEP